VYRFACFARNVDDSPIDEATSALDATSRIIVFEALRRWRKNKTTIVITHDLSQICPGDFVYVLKGGQVVEQGYRADLEMSTAVEEEGSGEFRAMMQSQCATGGFLPEKDVLPEEGPVEEILKDDDKDDRKRRRIRSTTMGDWMLDAVAELTKPAPIASPSGIDDK
jgi:ATP-binding cassette, subfamily B (MDR/TAP), member 1